MQRYEKSSAETSASLILPRRSIFGAAKDTNKPGKRSIPAEKFLSAGGSVAGRGRRGRKRRAGGRQPPDPVRAWAPVNSVAQRPAVRSRWRFLLQTRRRRRRQPAAAPGRRAAGSRPEGPLVQARPLGCGLVPSWGGGPSGPSGPQLRPAKARYSLTARVRPSQAAARIGLQNYSFLIFHFEFAPARAQRAAASPPRGGPQLLDVACVLRRLWPDSGILNLEFYISNFVTPASRHTRRSSRSAP